MGAMKVNIKLTNFFKHDKWVRQGDPSSPPLFNIYINDLFKSDIDHHDYVTLNEIDKITEPLFADDFILI